MNNFSALGSLTLPMTSVIPAALSFGQSRDPRGRDRALGGGAPSTPAAEQAAPPIILGNEEDKQAPSQGAAPTLPNITINSAALPPVPVSQGPDYASQIQQLQQVLQQTQQQQPPPPPPNIWEGHNINGIKTNFTGHTNYVGGQPVQEDFIRDQWGRPLPNYR